MGTSKEASDPPTPNRNGRRGDPVSLYPQTPEQVLRKLLNTPPPKDAEAKPKRRARSK